MRIKRFPQIISVRKLGRSIVLCVCALLVEVTCQRPAYSRASRPHSHSCNGFCRPQTYPNQTIGYDGQSYGLRSGGQGPLNASGSYGAMLEGRNPVGSTGF
jgi:hypothetical protein